MNEAPIEKQYIQDIGHKITVQFINAIFAKPISLNIKFNDENQFLMVSQNLAEIKPELSNYQNQIVIWEFGKIESLVENSGIEWVSCGLRALYYAMSLCKEVNVFGFGVDSYNQRGYYYDDQKLFKWAPHNPDKQELLIQELAKEKQINLYMGNAEKRL
jgi:hypothetical protein